ncbi:MAG: hypothetical protein HQL21_06100, partial [Candidatus Omnitrophica bacterium]|nr:hypothetical protein [Candidatus Omnitrophota bacterium]
MAQVILIREFMSAFGGNELMFVFLMAGWLLGIAGGAGRISSFFHNSPSKSAGLFLIAGLLLPALFIAAHLIRLWLGIPSGQIVDAIFAGGLSALFAVPLSMVYGAIFTALSRASGHGQEGKEKDIGGLYAIEALGFVVGGILLTGFLWISMGAVTIILMLTLCHLVWGTWILGLRSVGLIFVLAGLMLLAMGVPGKLGEVLSKLQWPGFKVMESRDSVFGRVTVVERSGQVSLFENGIFAYSTGDQMTAEESVHYALLAHALPKRDLLIGGGPGVISEALQYLNVRGDYVEM